MNSTLDGKDVSQKQGLILEIQKLSTDDGPGIRTTIFLKGCPLKCDWCHNPESIPITPGLQWFRVQCIGCKTCIEICPKKAMKYDEEGVHIDRKICTICLKCADECPSGSLKIFGSMWNLDALYNEIDKDRIYYERSGGGITISGGEPMLQTDFVLALLKKCKEGNIHTAVDTCGYTTKTNLEKLFPFVNLFLYDLKEINDEKHKQFTGISNKIILENCIWLVKKVREDRKAIWIRTPLIPNYTATDENIIGLANFIIKELDNLVDRWDLLAFNNLAQDKYDRMDWEWALEGLPLLERERVEYLYNLAIQLGVKNVFWSGMTKRESS
ncbi:MAG TPA: glycyl-radical enzyme activating protein [Candidatus Bathyarchaeia archaeon]|nr:glycyl-radical enzyme activating protein [Candidatus Bathyarchaeia archaeon]